MEDKNEILNKIERNKQNGWGDLEPDRRVFAMAYVVSYDHIEAAKEAGHAPSFGIKMLREPLVLAFIKHLQDERYVTNVITDDFVRTQFMNLIPKLSGQESVPIVLKSGEQIECRKFHAPELVSVLKELAKSTKFYEEGSGNLDSAAKTFADVFAEAVQISHEGESI